MAEEIALDIKINASAGANTVKDLKKELKSLKDELNNVEVGSAEFHKLTKAINNTEGKLGDLNDSFNTLTGSGVERAQKSFRLFSEGLTTFDFGKIKASLAGLGAAFRAIPIFLIVEGITYLIQNFDELSKGSGLLAKALQFLKGIFDTISNIAAGVAEKFGLVNTELERMYDLTEKKAKTAADLLAQQTAEIDRQIKVAKAAGRETLNLELQKQEAIIVTNKLLVEQFQRQVAAGKALTEEQQKTLGASLEAIRNARAEEVAIVAAKQKEIRAEEAKTFEAAKKQREEQLKDIEEFEKAIADTELQAARIKFEEEQNAALAKLDYEAQLDLIKQEQDLKAYEQKKALLDQEDADIQASLEQRKEGYRQLEEQKYEISKQSLQAIQAVSDLVFAHQLRQANGNAAKEREIKKRQFKLNKAFGIAGATIDGVQAVQKALNNPYPLNIVLAVLSGALAAANVIKIASTKFDDGGGGGGADAGGLGGGIGAAAPAIPQPNNSVTKIEEDGTNKASQQPVVKAVVVETDVTEKQNKVKGIEETSKIY